MYFCVWTCAQESSAPRGQKWEPDSPSTMVISSYELGTKPSSLQRTIPSLNQWAISPVLFFTTIIWSTVCAWIIPVYGFTCPSSVFHNKYSGLVVWGFHGSLIIFLESINTSVTRFFILCLCVWSFLLIVRFRWPSFCYLKICFSVFQFYRELSSESSHRRKWLLFLTNLPFVVIPSVWTLVISLSFLCVRLQNSPRCLESLMSKVLRLPPKLVPMQSKKDCSLRRAYDALQLYCCTLY